MPKPEKQKVTPDIVRQIAAITGLDVDDARAAELAPQLQGLRDGVSAMDEVDLTDVEPAVIFPMAPER